MVLCLFACSHAVGPIGFFAEVRALLPFHHDSLWFLTIRMCIFVILNVAFALWLKDGTKIQLTSRGYVSKNGRRFGLYMYIVVTLD